MFAEGCDLSQGVMLHALENVKRRQKGAMAWAELEFGQNPKPACLLHGNEKCLCGFWKP